MHKVSLVLLKKKRKEQVSTRFPQVYTALFDTMFPQDYVHEQEYHNKCVNWERIRILQLD